ncbi:MAG TPA: carboxypeptidase-like regulatory domain-containing protein [Cyclobacteriaceae bacterium]
MVKYILISIILFFFSNLLQAQQDTVKITFTNQSLTGILSALEANYPVSFYYKKSWLPERKLSISIQAPDMTNALEQLLKGTDLSFVTYSDYAFVIAKRSDLSRQFSEDYYVNKQEALRKNLLVSGAINLGDSSQINSTGKATISGTVKDKDTAEPLVGAIVFISDLNLSTNTDENGFYALDIPIGVHNAEIRLLGYEPLRQNINVLNNSTWNVEIYEEAVELEEVIVKGQADDQNINTVQIGLTRISPRQIRQVPSFLGEADLIKSILTLPGVSTVGEGAAGFNVRGGNIDQNLILQDGSLIFNSSHLLGFFSVFNPDALSDVSLYKGNIPAQYGGRLSSVLDVQVRDGNKEMHKLKAGIGLVSSKVLYEGPIKKGKTSFLLSGRSSYSDWIVRRFTDDEESSAFFFDVNAKVTHFFNGNNKVYLTYYRSHDNFKFSNQLGFEWDNETLGLNWSYIIDKSLFSNLTVNWGRNDNKSFDEEGFDAFNLTNGIEYFKIKEDITWSPSRHKINAGGEVTSYIMNPESRTPFNDQSSIASASVEKDDGREIGLYINDEFDLIGGFSMSIGLRYAIFQHLGTASVFSYAEGQPRTVDNIVDTTFFSAGDVINTFTRLEPRASLKVGLGSASSFKLSYNRNNQFIHLISNTSAAVPTAVWQVSTGFIPPAQADNYSIGFFKNFKLNTYETSLEIFYRDIDNIVEYKNLADLLINNQIETQLVAGDGEAYGAELLLKKATGRLTGSFAYTYSRSKNTINGDFQDEVINNGEAFPANFDQPHNVNLTLNYNVNKKNELSVNFTYRSGRPVTAPIASFRQGQTVIPHFSERNQFRIPDYHRLDVAYTINRGRVKRQRFKSSLTFSIYNLYSRNNAFSVFFRQDNASVTNAFKLTVLERIFPSVTYNIEF